MITFRILGVWLVLFALVALAVDATKSLASSTLMWTSFSDQWLALHPESFDATQVFVETQLYPWLWDPVLVTIFNAPAWIVLGGLGILLYWIGRKRPPSRVFVN